MVIPRLMSTQHPDNVNIPFFASSPELEGDDEINEAFYVFSQLQIDEQMWDYEGKEVDNYVVRKLLSKFDFFFQKHLLGKDIRLTFRVPNPEIEKTEAKILLETLESIPRSFDAAKVFYNEEVVPVFEVILPLTSSSQSLNRIYYYYKNFICGKKSKRIMPGDITVASWIGDFKPEKINVIPLFEKWDDLLSAGEIVEQYIKDKQLDHQRVFLARSDPAQNYGLISAVILNKLALQRLQRTSKKTGIDIFPIIGVGSAPFRGNFSPQNAKRVLEEYPWVQTYTIQSSFKYDHSPCAIAEAINLIKNEKRYSEEQFDEKRLLEIIAKYTASYRQQVKELAPLICKIAAFLPKRRKRKLHVGLFGYSRKIGKQQLPRAINFCAALYSIGLPPEIIGLNSLEKKDFDYLQNVYHFLYQDIYAALKYFDLKSNLIPNELKKKIFRFLPDFQTNENYLEISRQVTKTIMQGKTYNLNPLLLKLAKIRNFLG